MPYPLSSEVSPAQPTLASQYNNLRLDAITFGQAIVDSLKLQTFLRKYIAGMNIQYLATNRLTIPYSSTDPATVMINGCMLQATEAIDLPPGLISGGMATYYIFANRSANSTTFTLSVNTSSAEGPDQRVLGYCMWNGSAITTIVSYSYRPTILPPADYDSGYFACAYNNAYSRTHGLMAVPRMVMLLHSANADGSGENVVVGVVKQSTTAFYAPIGFDAVSIYVNSALDSAGGCVYSKRRESGAGYYRILAWK
jgi:hypothetical protein